MPNLEVRRSLGKDDFYVVAVDRTFPPGRVRVGNPNGSEAHYFIGGAPQIPYPALDPRYTYDIFADPNPTATTGTVTLTKGGTAVAGVGTLFTTEFVVGDVIQLANGLILGTIASIASPVSMTLATPWLGFTGAGQVLLKATPSLRTLSPGGMNTHDLPLGGIQNRTIIFVRSRELPIDVVFKQINGQWTILQDGRVQKQLA